MSTGNELHAGRNDPEEILKPQGQLESQFSENELTIIKKIPQQIKEIVEQSARIEHQLKGMNKDIKQINKTRNNKLACQES